MGKLFLRAKSSVCSAGTQLCSSAFSARRGRLSGVSARPDPGGSSRTAPGVYSLSRVKFQSPGGENEGVMGAAWVGEGSLVAGDGAPSTSTPALVTVAANLLGQVTDAPKIVK